MGHQERSASAVRYHQKIRETVEATEISVAHSKDLHACGPPFTSPRESQLSDLAVTMPSKQFVAWLAAALVFTSFFMKTMLALRCVAVASNFAFIAFALLGYESGVFDKVLPILVLHTALLPLNLHRLRQVIRSGRGDLKCRRARTRAIDQLESDMARQTAGQGETLFHRNTPADRLYVVKSGCLYLPELNRRLGPGQVLADAGLWESNGLRKASAICESDCELFYMTRQKIFGSSYRQRQIAFLIMRGLYELCTAPKHRIPIHTPTFDLRADSLNAYP
jgi:hypothetical protein